MENACRNIATAMAKIKPLCLYLKKPNEILNADWKTVQNYIKKSVYVVCLSIEEQNALNDIHKCRTLHELTKCRHDLYDTNQKSDGVCYIRGALDRMIELTRTGKFKEKKMGEDYYRINVLSQLHDLSFLYCQELDSRQSECRPLHQSTNVYDINRVDGIITSNNTHDLLFIEEKPPGSSSSSFTQDNIKCEKLRLDNLQSILKEIKSTKLHRHVEILSMNVNGI
ncbi:hypothetical protein BDC45DRAFT_533048 [Circinella umbellata]|nr:hypothetical protein BDC45DRAFT_533048 [Circinella umbellata]